MRTFLKFFMVPALAIMAMFAACTKSESVEVEEYVDEALYSVQERGGVGKYGCYELVFPVSFTLPDETVVEVNTYDEIKEALRNYFSNNPNPNGNGGGPRFGRKINFVFPISVINGDGEVITVEDAAELATLRRACAGTFGNHGHQGHGNHGVSCFEIVFPITVNFPDGTTAEVADRRAFRQAVRQWNANNPGNTTRPTIAFPITIKMTDDGSLVTVNSSEELRTIKDNCE